MFLDNFCEQYALYYRCEAIVDQCVLSPMILFTYSQCLSICCINQASPDFQSEHGYDKDKPNKANLAVASTHVRNIFLFV